MASLNDYLSFVKTSRNREPLVKLELLRKETELPLKQITSKLKLDGSLNISNGNGVRRSFSISLDNTLREFYPSLESKIWVGQRVRLSIGYVINGEDYYIKQGTFVHDNPTVNSDGSVTINAVDKFSLLDGSLAGKLDKILIIPITTTLGNAIRTIMAKSQDDKEIIIPIEIDSLPIAYQIIEEEGSTLGSILIKLANAFSCNVYYNQNGNLVFEKDTSDSSKGAIWSYNADLDSETNYIDGSTEYNFNEVVNSIKVIGDNVNGQIFQATVQNNDLLSDTSIPNLGLEILDVIKDDIIYTDEYCRQRGLYELKRVTNVLTSSRLDSIILPHLDVDKVIKLTSLRLNFTNKRGLINSISMPLDNSSNMSLEIVDTFDIDLS